ncbi:hypothetical protein CI109_102915 [Kwoniella shandongensis]|uniref:Uncharacterized protein n=1 Tax=Kwoniella shandongensis TaxID=1734106 RepID=A0A5M6C8D1_9TREE|nr:uncharacterized protein CI109_000103 [Kwoniella shandongensis]KAA5531263.1 hypothetical protein CI109_000103 [Kwoniella shandongensis]
MSPSEGSTLRPHTSYAKSPKGSHAPGSGHVHLALTSSNRASFITSLAAYPLKLLSPTPLPSQPSHLAVIYTLAYGGGLVAGDVVSLRVNIDQGCGLIMLTQGSTKVFKRRPGIRPLSHPPTSLSVNAGGDPNLTRQRMHVTLQSGSFLLLLPDSISPFRASSYSQTQRFVLPQDGTASILILDWVNSGRGQRMTTTPEEKDEEIWSMEKYGSTNEVFIGEKLVMRERMVLDNATFPQIRKGGLSEIARQLAPYNIYATLLLLGPHLIQLLNYLKTLADRTRQFQLKEPPGLIWSFSETEEGQGGVLRIAAREVEDARKWLRGVLYAGGIGDMVGEGLWPRLI